MATPIQRSLFLASVKLAQEVGSEPGTNSTGLISTTIRQTNAQGELLSVGEWSRQTIVQDTEWLVKIAKRDKDVRKDGSGAVRITFGNGFDALVAIDCQEFPQEISEMNKVGVVVCISTVDDDDDTTRLSHRGLVHPSSSIFDHLQACVEGGQKEQDIRIYIHTNVSPWADVHESFERTQIYRVETNHGEPFSMGRMEHLLPLEEQLRATGKIGISEEEKKPAAKKSAPAKAPTTEKKPAPTAKAPSKAEKARAAASEAPSTIAHETPSKPTAPKAKKTTAVATNVVQRKIHTERFQQGRAHLQGGEG
jgi:hypothetical protein